MRPKHVTMVLVAAGNLIIASVLLLTIWKYHSTWNKTPAELKSYRDAGNLEALQVQLDVDEKLLDVLHYWYLPLTAVMMLISGVLFLVFRKCSRDDLP